MKMRAVTYSVVLLLSSLVILEAAKDKIFPFADEIGIASDKNCKEFSEGKEGALLGVTCDDAVSWLLNETGTNFIESFEQLSDKWCGCEIVDEKCDKINILPDGTCDSKAPTQSPTSVPSLIPSSAPSEFPTTSFPPSNLPSVQPSASPSAIPSPTPSSLPSSDPSSSPSSTPSKIPTSSPVEPTLNPTTSEPSTEPTTTAEPSMQPVVPTLAPKTLVLTPEPTTAEPSSFPTSQPSINEISSDIPRVFMTFWFPVGTDIPPQAVESAVNIAMQEMGQGNLGPASTDLETNVIVDSILGLGTVSAEGTWTGPREDAPTEASFAAAFNFWAIDEMKSALADDGYPIDRFDVQVNGNLLVVTPADENPSQPKSANTPSGAKLDQDGASDDSDDRNKHLQLVAYLFLAPLGLLIVVIAICCCMDMPDRKGVGNKALDGEDSSTNENNALNVTHDTEATGEGVVVDSGVESSIGTDDTSVFTSGMTGLSMMDPLAEERLRGNDAYHHRAGESPALPVGYALYPDDEGYLDDIDSKNNLLLGALGDLEAPDESDDEDLFVDEETIEDTESHKVTSRSLHASDVYSLASNTMYLSAVPSSDENDTKDPPANFNALKPFEEYTPRNSAANDDDQTRTSYLEY